MLHVAELFLVFRFFFFQIRKRPLGYLVKLKYVINQLLSHLKGEKKGRSSRDGDLMLSFKSRSLKNANCYSVS